MADALVSLAVEKLSSVLEQEVILFAGARHELEKLKRTFQSIQAVLADAECKQVAERAVQLWLSRLRSISYDISNMLDKWEPASNEVSDDDEDGDRNRSALAPPCLPSPYACLDHTVSRFKAAHRIKDIREKLDQISKDKEQFHFSQSSSNGYRSRPLTGSHIEEKMIGREYDKEVVMDRLVSGSSSSDQDGLQELHVIAIVGIGGLGKTSLAREIYSDNRVKRHFKMVLWVCVSKPFDVMMLMKAILEVIEGKKTDLSQPSAIQNKLLKALEGKRFLLVLDDVWNEDKEMWNQLRAPLTGGAAGSTILVTTRALKVAKIVSAVCIHELKGLSEDDSWRLFSSRAFAGKKPEECLELESIGRAIVKKCKGLPLSIKVIGSVMNSKRTAENWKNILDSNMWSLEQVADKILPALLLSYCNLPPHLKQCFTYCSIYKKDTEMKKRELVELWVAEGFIQSQENGDMEAIGDEYFEDLVAWSIFQEVCDDGSSCKMHDLLHDLAEYIMKEETYIYTTEKANPCPANVRHASFSLSPSITPIKSIQAKKLRSLFLDGVDNAELVAFFCRARFLRALIFKGLEIKTLPNSVRKLRHLRVLDMSSSYIVELPDAIAEMNHLRYLNLSASKLVELPNAIGKLKHLRCLDLSYTRIVKLPDVIGKMKQLRYLDLSWSGMVELTESMSHLANLHTLKLNHCSELKKLPGNMDRMVGLRHLEIKKTDSLECLPKVLGRITSLRSLSKFIVGGEGGCGVDELQQLNLLEGNLTLQHLESVPCEEEARKAELWNKQHLSQLVLEMEKREKENVTTERDAETERIDSVLEGLQPHVNLKKLKLDCKRRSSKLPSWMEKSSFSKLTELEIGGFIQCEVLPGLGKLVTLRYLRIRDVRFKKVCNEVSDGNSGNDVAGRSEVAFPKLERLVLEDVELEEWELTLEAFLQLWNRSNLEGLTQHLAIFPLLIELHIVRCHGIKGIECSSSFPLLETFTLNDNSEFFSSELPHLPNLKEFYIKSIRNETLPDGGWELLAALQHLEIKDCNEVKSLPNELRHLQSLENLTIEHCRKLESLPEGLGQLKKLRSLRIYGLEGLTCLHGSLGQSESLEKLNLYFCKQLELLPEGLGQLKKLQSLKIFYLEGLTCLLDSVEQLESLENLEIRDCHKLESLPKGLEQLKKLKSLSIWGAEALTYLPDSLGHLQSLEELYMDGLKKLQVLPEELGRLKKLKSLKISGDLEALTCLPNWVGQLESLESLEIRGWKKLESVPDRLLGGLKKLEELTIIDMEALTCLPDSLERLESLKSLEIRKCNKLKSLPRGLGQLTRLAVVDVPGPALTDPPAPDTLGKLKSSLEFLEIGEWEELESLPHWVRQLKKLRKLRIYDCEALRSLPHWLQDLPLLHSLFINNCPLLLERCKRPELGGGGGEDWPKISRIPIIHINYHRM